MQYIPRLTLFFFVALAICLAQTITCGPDLSLPYALCAAWIAYEAFRPLMSRWIKFGVGVVVALLGLLGCLCGLFLYGMAGFNQWGSTPAEVIAHNQLVAELMIAPSTLLLASGVVSIWGTWRVKRDIAVRRQLLFPLNDN